MTIKERMEKLDAVLDEYEGKCGLGKIRENQQLDKILIEDIDYYTLTDETANSIAAQLAQFNFHLQRCANKEYTRMTWADSLIKKCYADEDFGGKYMSADEKKSALLKNNDYAAKLEEIRVYAQARFNRIGFVAQRLDKLCDTLIELARTKRAKAKTVERDNHAGNF